MTAELIAPGTGRALVVRRGQVLRIEQVRGRQVVDLNLFCLADGRERLSASRTRALHGLSIAIGDSLWSAAPRERPLMTLIGDSAAARHDVSFPACSAFEYAFASGVPGHTNCAEIQAESIRRFGLGPDDVHDPLNLWMEGGAARQPAVVAAGRARRRATASSCWRRWRWWRRSTPAATTCSTPPPTRWRRCGRSVRAATAAERALLVPARRRGPAGRARPLRADPGYRRRYRTDAASAQRVRGRAARLGAARAWTRCGRHGGFGETDGEIVRAVLFRWWLERHARTDAAGYSGK